MIDRNPISVKLGHSIRVARLKGRFFIFGGLLHEAKRFAARGLVWAGFVEVKDTGGFQNPRRS